MRTSVVFGADPDGRRGRQMMKLWASLLTVSVLVLLGGLVYNLVTVCVLRPVAP
jgi:hypothetical protein